MITDYLETNVHCHGTPTQCMYVCQHLRSVSVCMAYMYVVFACMFVECELVVVVATCEWWSKYLA